MIIEIIHYAIQCDGENCTNATKSYPLKALCLDYPRRYGWDCSEDGKWFCSICQQKKTELLRIKKEKLEKIKEVEREEEQSRQELSKAIEERRRKITELYNIGYSGKEIKRMLKVKGTTFNNDIILLIKKGLVTKRRKTHV